MSSDSECDNEYLAAQGLLQLQIPVFLSTTNAFNSTSGNGESETSLSQIQPPSTISVRLNSAQPGTNSVDRDLLADTVRLRYPETDHNSYSLGHQPSASLRHSSYNHNNPQSSSVSRYNLYDNPSPSTSSLRYDSGHQNNQPTSSFRYNSVYPQQLAPPRYSSYNYLVPSLTFSTRYSLFSQLTRPRYSFRFNSDNYSQALSTSLSRYSSNSQSLLNTSPVLNRPTVLDYNSFSQYGYQPNMYRNLTAFQSQNQPTVTTYNSHQQRSSRIDLHTGAAGDVRTRIDKKTGQKNESSKQNRSRSRSGNASCSRSRSQAMSDRSLNTHSDDSECDGDVLQESEVSSSLDSIPYACHICLTLFPTTSALSQHLSTHTQDEECLLFSSDNSSPDELRRQTAGEISDISQLNMPGETSSTSQATLSEETSDKHQSEKSGQTSDSDQFHPQMSI